MTDRETGEALMGLHIKAIWDEHPKEGAMHMTNLAEAFGWMLSTPSAISASNPVLFGQLHARVQSMIKSIHQVTKADEATQDN